MSIEDGKIIVVGGRWVSGGMGECVYVWRWKDGWIDKKWIDEWLGVDGRWMSRWINGGN